MTEPGWFDDPWGDPAVVRWYDGVAWTGTTQARPAEAVLPDPTATPVPLPTPAPLPLPASAARRGRRGPLVIVVAVVAVALIVAGLVVVRSRSEDVASRGGPAPSVPPSATGPGWAGLFARMPAGNPDRRQISGSDLAALRQRSGIDGISPRYNAAQTDELMRLAVGPVPNAWNTDEPKRWKAELGVYPFQLDRGLEVEHLGTDQMSRLEGTVDVSVVTAAVTAPDSFGPGETVMYQGTDYLRFPGTEMKPSTDKAHRTLEPLRRPVRIAIGPDRILISLTDAGMRQLIDAEQGHGTLSREPGMTELAVQLDGMHALDLTVVPGDGDAGSSAGSAPPGTATDQQFGPRAYAWAAAGVAFPHDVAQGYLVFSHADPATAQRHALELRRTVTDGRSVIDDTVWSEKIEIDQIEAAGSLAVGLFRTEKPVLVLSALLKRDSLVQFGG